MRQLFPVMPLRFPGGSNAPSRRPAAESAMSRASQPGHFTPRPEAATEESIVLLIDGTEQEQEHDYEHELTRSKSSPT